MFAFLLVILCSVIILGCVAELQQTMRLLVVAHQVGILLHNPIPNNAFEERVVDSEVLGRIGLAELPVTHLAHELGGVLHNCNYINFRLAPMGCATKLIWFWNPKLLILLNQGTSFKNCGRFRNIHNSRLYGSSPGSAQRAAGGWQWAVSVCGWVEQTLNSGLLPAGGRH